VLAIDPENLPAHYNLMLICQGAGDREMAKRHEALHSGSEVGGGSAYGGGPPVAGLNGDRPPTAGLTGGRP
jgi:hypothetical protein